MRRIAPVLVGVVLASVLPAGHSLAAGECPTRPYADPRLSLANWLTDVVVGEATSVGGNLTRNSCPLPPSKVGLFARTKPGRFTWIAGTTTDSAGHYDFVLKPRQTMDLVVIYSGAAGYARTVSRQSHITVYKERPQFYPYSPVQCPSVQRDPQPPPVLPDDVTIEVRNAPPTLRAGQDGYAELVIRNDSREDVTLTGYSAAAWVRNPRSGEFAPVRPCKSGYRSKVVIPSRDIFVEQLYFTTMGQRPVWGGDYEVVVAAWYRPDPNDFNELPFGVATSPLRVEGERV